jgi:anti-sigma regulatory factor (Ser/Thr protein kinase)
MSDITLVLPENFIQATRDSGYKSIGSALAELVDNSFEAGAKNVAISIEKFGTDETSDVHVTVRDDGVGMDTATLRRSLQFGWSSRFNRRDGNGRYGLGLPNASLSHARRVDVISSRDGEHAAATYLDVDEVAQRHVDSIPEPVNVPWSEFTPDNEPTHGTIVTWQKCDRLVTARLGPLTRKLRAELGRLFRYQLWARKTISVNGEDVAPFDPLFVKKGANLKGAIPYGPALTYPIALGTSGWRKTSVVRVRFSQLPIALWHSLSNEEKNRQGIAKNAGVSIVRGGREIDRGWFFIGQKRKENYDDWWRCEVQFDADLDEWFGVTHTKQEIHPTDALSDILSPDIERIARELNANARRAFIAVKAEMHRRKSELQAEKFDNLIEPPRLRRPQREKRRGGAYRSRRISGVKYKIRFARLDDDCVFQPELQGLQLTVRLNEAHPFVQRFWPNESERRADGTETQRLIELFLLAAARSEFAAAVQRRDRKHLADFRKRWSNILTTFLN